MIPKGRTHSQFDVLRLVRLAAAPTLAAWATLAGLAWFTVTAPDTTVVVAEVLRLLLALTVPHALVVLWLDRVAARRTTPAVAG